LEISMSHAAELRALLGADRSWQKSYPQVGEIIRRFLSQYDFPPVGYINTSIMASRLWPETERTDRDTDAVRRLFQAIKALAKNDLIDCCRKDASNPITYMGKTGYRSIWHRPDPSKRTARVTVRSPEHALASQLAAMSDTALPDVLDWIDLVETARRITGLSVA
jgi:hypothetical protein